MNNKTTERLLAATQDIWEGYLNHPFVHGIADGSLDIQKFRFYLLQDYVYLFDYAKVFAQGVVKSRDPEIMRVFATSVANILGGEMNIHRGYMSRLGITEVEAERVKPSLNNESYTSYMRAVAAEEGPAEIMAAVLSCALSYEDNNYSYSMNGPYCGLFTELYAVKDSFKNVYEVLANKRI